MFVTHTPPFRGRGRRRFNRGWRLCNNPHALSPGCRRLSSEAHIVILEGTSLSFEATDKDLEDVGEEYCFRRAVPGVPAEQLQVTVAGPMLTVRTLTEVPGQRFEWRVAIPHDVSSDDITAEVKDGFLNVRLPKQRPHDIAITTNGHAGELWNFENWGGAYRLTHPAPAVRISDVKVKVLEGFVFVEVKSKNARFSREVALPPGVDVDGVSADIVNGILVVTLPKIEKDVIRVYSVETSEDEALYDEARLNAS